MAETLQSDPEFEALRLIFQLYMLGRINKGETEKGAEIREALDKVWCAMPKDSQDSMRDFSERIYGYTEAEFTAMLKKREL